MEIENGTRSLKSLLYYNIHALYCREYCNILSDGVHARKAQTIRVYQFIYFLLMLCPQALVQQKWPPKQFTYRRSQGHLVTMFSACSNVHQQFYVGQRWHSLRMGVISRFFPSLHVPLYNFFELVSIVRNNIIT